MPIRSQENALGAWAFFMGVVIAVIVGLSASLINIPAIQENSKLIYGILIILGIIVGYMISGKDSMTFLFAGTALVIVSKFAMDVVTQSLIGIGLGTFVKAVFGALITLFAPATIIVALKAVFGIAKV